MQLERRAADADAAVAILRQAAAAGVNHIDTAQFYGACNALIRAALAPYPCRTTTASSTGPPSRYLSCAAPRRRAADPRHR
jgi:aryl-alcohol dehydrogenase-like predicted oxidoreductase